MRPASSSTGIDSISRYYNAFWKVFPHARVSAVGILETQDKVVRPVFDATGEQVRISGMTTLRFDGDHCVERWSVTDSLPTGEFYSTNIRATLELIPHSTA